MPKPAHVRIAVTGSLPGGESFSFGWCYAGEAGNQATLDAMVAAVHDAMATPGTTLTTFRNLLAPSSSYQAITGYSYAAGASAATYVSEVTFVAVGTGGNVLPNQVAVVATTRTGLAGRRNRGRMYLCATGAQPDANGRLSDPAPQDVSNAVVAAFAAGDIGTPPAVISAVGSSANDIVRVSVDNRFDIIRGRANSEAATVTGSTDV